MLDVPKYRFTLVYMLFVTYFQSFSNLIGKFYDILKIRIKNTVLTWINLISLSRKPRAVDSGRPKCFEAFPVPHSK